MVSCLLQALKQDFAPLEGFEASKILYPAHHLPGATLRGFPMKPWALLNSRWVLVVMLMLLAGRRAGAHLQGAAMGGGWAL